METKKMEVIETKKIKEPLKIIYNQDEIDNTLYVEIGVDEAGRGPLFGRVYTAAVILPKNNSFEHSKMKDSKKFTSSKKIQEVAQYIKNNAIAWAVAYEDENVIDDINILQATQKAMHKAILDIKSQLNDDNIHIQLLIDGNYFIPITKYNKKTNKIDVIPYVCVEKGDNTYTSIAAASILAKVERDAYISEMCLKEPELIEKYGIDTNKGYGTKKHMEGIRLYGITKWHRKTFTSHLY